MGASLRLADGPHHDCLATSTHRGLGRPNVFASVRLSEVVSRLLARQKETVLPLMSRNDAAVKHAAPKFAPSVDCLALGHWTGVDRCSNGASTIGSAPISS